MTQTYTLSGWSLADLFPALDSPDTQAAFDRLEAEVGQFESWRQQLDPGISDIAFMHRAIAF